MLKNNKKEYDRCIKCGKPLSKYEIKKGVSKCENCIGKHVRIVKKVLAGVSAGIGTVATVVVFVVTLGKKGKL